MTTGKDGAAPASAKGQRQKKLEERLKERYYCLPGREIENLLSPRVILKVLEGYGESVGELGELNMQSYLTKPLGSFIEDAVFGDARKKLRRGTYKQESGTISDKVGFCKRAVDATKSWDDLSEEAKDLTQKVFRFIASLNSRRGSQLV